MKTTLKAAAALAIGATMMMGAAPAMARVNVDVNVGLPGVFYPAPPVYVQPRPVYVQPQPVYVQPPAYGYGYGSQWHRGHRHHGRGDWDHDGIPNRYDHDRDGDGVPNRYDRQPNNPYRR
jgi:hypothetical protein